eukprot:TRINITY_DN35528_c0_g1_i1.p1 TRINITY_DN35528_c0_g1~~TRINITY_DN35528_c0_g1_i1.p1  ORF type:complete len:604 (+),score=127.66 TRINITY_DN35528_c0_g1_i1:32-1813(+)
MALPLASLGGKSLGEAGRAMPTMSEKLRAKKAEEMLKVFKNMDVNQDGVLTRPELTALMKELDVEQWTDDKIESLMGQIDRNRDGIIDYDDFVTWLMSSSARKSDRDAVMSTGKFLLTLEKLKALVGDEAAGPILIDRMLEKLFDFYDEDDDGLIERLEFIAAEEKKRRMHGIFEPLDRSQRQALIKWLQEAGAQGDLVRGLFLEKAEFKEAMIRKAKQESGLSEEEWEERYMDRLADWMWEEQCKTLLQGEDTHNVIGVTDWYTIREEGSRVFCVSFSPDDAYIAAGFENGEVGVYTTDLEGKEKMLLYKPTGGEPELPITALRWRPQCLDTETVHHLLLAVGSDGRVRQWMAPVKKLLHEKQHEAEELFCAAYRPDGAQFAVAGKRHVIYVYDEETKEELFRMDGTAPGSDDPPTFKRIFSLKWHPTEPNILLSGGWDTIVKIWDLSEDARNVMRTITGPYIAGDTLDISYDGKTVLVGCASEHGNNLQLWNFNSGEQIDQLDWRNDDGQPCKVYGAQFSKHDGSRLVLAGGSAVSEVKIFRKKARRWETRGQVFLPVESGGWCQALDFSNSGEQVAVGTGNGSVRVARTF